MKQIIPGLWHIDEIDTFVNYYAWAWDGGVTLIDAGMKNDAPALLDALSNHGWPLHTIRRVLVTHSDAEGLLTLARTWVRDHRTPDRKEPGGRV